MDRRERKAILGEHGPYGEDLRERRVVERLEEDLRGSPLKGRPLPRRLRNFRPGVDAYVAGVHGPPAYVRRIAEIEALTEEHLHRLEQAYARLAGRHARDEFEQRWRTLASRWNFGAVNELIDRHNRWYPAEAKLPMDPRTGDFVPVAGRTYQRERLDAAWILRTFPPRLADAA